MNISMKLVYQYMEIFFNFSPTSNHLHPALFYIPGNGLNFPTTKGFRMKISMQLVYQYMAIFFNFSPTSNHLHPLQVENYDSNSRRVVDGDVNVNSGLKGLNKECFLQSLCTCCLYLCLTQKQMYNNTNKRRRSNVAFMLGRHYIGWADYNTTQVDCI